ncbi:hypothetical protein AVEN_125023-1 [Araneus ventricosus]|uniref:Uncharacterized protein n=1 Tax=Araneus ventricosus TaxID=182803 RepID=A0A4Y2H058_ARAVE|nr:hypothetical protein AVEN_125023-1 [Araneus ventricosus]
MNPQIVKSPRKTVVLRVQAFSRIFNFPISRIYIGAAFHSSASGQFIGFVVSALRVEIVSPTRIYTRSHFTNCFSGFVFSRIREMRPPIPRIYTRRISLKSVSSRFVCFRIRDEIVRPPIPRIYTDCIPQSVCGFDGFTVARELRPQPSVSYRSHFRNRVSVVLCFPSFVGSASSNPTYLYRSHFTNQFPVVCVISHS